MADYDETNPGDSDIVSQYPANARAARAAVKTNFGVDHQETDGADVGKHEVIQLVDNAADPTIAAGQVGVWNNAGVLKTRAAGGTVGNLATEAYVDAAIAAAADPPFAAGTKMVFYQASAPTNWTQDTSVNDRVLKVVSGAGGGTGGSWTITGVTVNNHTLTEAQMPSHNHSGSTGSDSHSHTGSTNTTGSHSHGLQSSSSQGSSIDIAARGTTSGTNSYNTGSAGSHSHSLSIDSDAHSHTVSIGSTGGGTGHNHGLTADGAWRPSHINVIVCTKD